MGDFPNEPCDKLEATFTHQKIHKAQSGTKREGSHILTKVYSEILHFEESCSVRKIH